MFSAINETEDFFEVDILSRIQEDYLKYHENNLVDYIRLLNKELLCPNCKSIEFIKYGKNKSGSIRYKCKSCGKTFSSLKDRLFFSSKINLKAWFAFLECILSGSSTLEACIVAKISPVTGVEWMKKIFKTLNHYQENIILGKKVYIDET